MPFQPLLPAEPPTPTPEEPINKFSLPSPLLFPPLLSLHFNIITNPSVIQIASIIQFLLRSAGGGFPVAEQEKAKGFEGGLEKSLGNQLCSINLGFWLPQTMELINTHMVSI